MRFSWLTIRDILSCCRTDSTVRPGPRSAEVDEARIIRDHCNFQNRLHKGERSGCRTRMAAKH